MWDTFKMLLIWFNWNIQQRNNNLNGACYRKLLSNSRIVFVSFQMVKIISLPSSSAFPHSRIPVPMSTVWHVWKITFFYAVKKRFTIVSCIEYGCREICVTSTKIEIGNNFILIYNLVCFPLLYVWFRFAVDWFSFSCFAFDSSIRPASADRLQISMIWINANFSLYFDCRAIQLSKTEPKFSGTLIVRNVDSIFSEPQFVGWLCEFGLRF